MIEIKLTVTNTETDFAREIIKSMDLDEFEALLQQAPKFPFVGSSLDEFIKIRDFFKETPFKGLLKSMTEYMLHDIVENRDKYLEEEPCTKSQ